MANLSENPAVFESGIYQIETTDPVLGGVPNVATGAGMSNIPHLQLANRTAFLKGVIDGAGLGAAAVPLVTLNSAQARLTGSYRFASGDANTPAVGVAGTLEVIAASASAVNQMAFDSASSRMWTRFWNGTVWSPWDLIWSSARGLRSFGSTGYNVLADGTVFQWGGGAGTTGSLQPSGAAEAFATVLFPYTFPNLCTFVGASPLDVAGNAFQEQANAQIVNNSSFTLNLQCRQASTAMSARWFAAGY
ncbi:MAG: hypothetical protein IOC92_14625 [Rhodobacter sp.]|nr:hypothetical protein [Rhodobacter sp.]MCA3462266.1 hypothetical protein [Rhodobacter sp.]MCA3462749.1 hypothetical protein [Rhodobacter sp.]MCA3468112.1 hypothetical protein [Rhodobacter sp.]MCA3480866.1 hypothetical protein [Rhodobacter sp.]